MYFESFFFISNYGTQKNMTFDIEAARCKTVEDMGKMSSCTSNFLGNMKCYYKF